MNTRTPPRRRVALVAAAAAGAAILGAGVSAVSTLAAAAGSTTAPSTTAGSTEASSAPPPLPAGALADDGVTAEWGGVPPGTTVFDEGVPAIARLEPALAEALREAATAAGEDGLVFVVNSGWRSPEYQAQLLRDAVDEYGSEEEAARWVATPQTSPHVSGDAVDLATDAAVWLSDNGARFGLCQTYANEAWHFELRAEAGSVGCPERFPDPTFDPRMW